MSTRTRVEGVAAQAVLTRRVAYFVSSGAKSSSRSSDAGGRLVRPPHGCSRGSPTHGKPISRFGPLLELSGQPFWYSVTITLNCRVAYLVVGIRGLCSAYFLLGVVHESNPSLATSFVSPFVVVLDEGGSMCRITDCREGQLYTLGSGDARAFRKPGMMHGFSARQPTWYGQ